MGVALQGLHAGLGLVVPDSDLVVVRTREQVGLRTRDHDTERRRGTRYESEQKRFHPTPCPGSAIALPKEQRKAIWGLTS